MGKQLTKKPSLKTDDKLEKIKDNIHKAHDYFKDNRKFYSKFRRFLYKTTVTDDDQNAMIANETPNMSLNITEAYVSHFLGQLSMHEPSYKFRALTNKVNYEQVKLIEAYVRFMMGTNGYGDWQNECIKEAITGGYSVARIYTDYVSDESFDQEIRIEKIFDPTLSGFDPLARKSHKGDSKFCYFFTPMTKKDFESKYPDVDLSKVDFSKDFVNNSPVRWYQSGDYKRDEIVYVCDYFEKKRIKKKLLWIPNPYTDDVNDRIVVTEKDYKRMKDDWEEEGNILPFPDEPIDTRIHHSHEIIRYRLIGDCFLEDPVLTDYYYLPLIFLDGNSAFIEGQQITRSYFYNAIDCQRIKNYLASQMLNDIENQQRAPFAMPEAGIPENEAYREGLENPQKVKGVLFYKHADDEGNPIPPLQQLSPTPPNQQLHTLYSEMSNTMQQIFGTYDAQLGLQRTDLSGKAIIEGALQSSLTSMPFVTNYVEFLSHISLVITDLLPKYYTTFRTLPVITEKGNREYIEINIDEVEESFLKYTHNDIGVEIEPGLNLDAQKNRALQSIISLMQTSQTFNAMMESEGLGILIENLDIRGQEQLREMATRFMEQQKQQQEAAQPNPQEQLLKIEQERTQLEHQSREAKNSIEQERVKNSRIELMLKAFKTMEDLRLAREKAETEKQKKDFDMAIESSKLQIKMIEQTLKDVSTGMGGFML